MKSISFLTTLACVAISLTMAAQTYTIPPTNINRSGFPRINEDLTVEFQVKAPDANLVQIDLCGKKYDLVRDEEGVWKGTTDPQVPGFHYYFLIVDGVSVADPASESFYGCGRMSSAIDIPEDGCEWFEISDVPHGQVRTLSYYSNQSGSWRPIMVYTPPTYDTRTAEGRVGEYPVIYIYIMEEVRTIADGYSRDV